MSLLGQMNAATLTGQGVFLTHGYVRHSRLNSHNNSKVLLPFMVREATCGCNIRRLSQKMRIRFAELDLKGSVRSGDRHQGRKQIIPTPSRGFNPQTQLRKTSRDTEARAAVGAGSAGGPQASTSEPGFPSQPGLLEDSSTAAVPRLVPWPDSSRPRVCIIGGGFGGLYTALRLDSLTWPADKRPQIVLVDQSDRFVFKPMLYELLNKEADPWEIAPPFRELLSRTSVRFLKGTVKSVAPLDREGVIHAVGPGGTVRLGSGEEIVYDWLVLALGAEMKMTFVAGAKENALPFSTLEDAQRVDKELTRLEADLRKQRSKGQSPQPLRISVIGGGYTGVELASTVAERFGPQARVQIIEPSDTIVASGVQGNREAAKKVLMDRNVELALGYRVTAIKEAPGRPAGSTRAVMEVEHASASSSKPADIEADLVLWTVGTKAVAPQGDTSSAVPFPLNSRGQTETDETLRVKGHPRVFALGDAAGVASSKGETLAPTAQVAFQAADYVGWNIWAAINGRPLRPFKYQHLGEMMTLGAKDGTVTLNLPGGLTLEGPLGNIARKIAYAYRMPTTEHKIRVGLSWATRAAFETASSLLPSLTAIFR